MKEPVTILVPDFYRPLTAAERHALTSVQVHLGDFPITFLKAESENLWYELGELCPDADTVSYDDRYFASRQSFAKLLLGGKLYEDFSWTRYLLILEVNTVINRNELAHWCRQGYDLVQMDPGVTKNDDWLDHMNRRLYPSAYLTKNNGWMLEYAEMSGISLRRVEACRKVTRRKKRLIHHYLTTHPNLGSDAPFWEFYLNRWRSNILVPNQVGREFFVKPYSDHLFNGQSTDQPFAYTGLSGSSVLPPYHTL